MLAKSHSEPSKKKRKAKKTVISKGVVPTFTERYNKADDTIGAIYVDIANGVSRSDIIEKITKGLYDGMERPLAVRTAHNYYNAALDRFAVDTDIEAKKLKDLFYGRYEAILEQCIKNGDMYNARATLDSMAKIFIGLDKPTTAIQINSDKEDGITINFGFEHEN